MTTDVDVHPSRFLSVEAICSSKHNKKKLHRSYMYIL